MRAAAKVADAETAVHEAVIAAMTAFLEVARRRVLDEPGSLSAAAGDDGQIPPGPPRLDAFPNEAVWLEFVDGDIMPVVQQLWGEAFRDAARQADIADTVYREAYLTQVRDRLRLWPHAVFEELRYELLESHRQGEGIVEQTARIGRTLNIDAVSRRLQAEIDHVEKALDDPEADLEPVEKAQLKTKRAALYEEMDADKGRWEWMSERIARTETMGALNGGSHSGALAWTEDSGQTLFKQWLSTNDSRTRETHVAADGQVRPLREAYDVGGYPLQFPGDPTGPGHEVIHCRCTSLHLDGEEAKDAAAQYAAKSLQAAGTPDKEITMGEPAAFPIGWRGIIAPMGVPTGDGRMLAIKTAEELRLRDMPLVFSSQEALSTGHDGATITGNIEKVWVTADDMIGGAGRFDLGSPEGQETARLLHEGFARWVSADPDDVTWAEQWFDADGKAIDPPTEDEWIAQEEAMWAGEPGPLDDRKVVMCMDDYRIMGCTFVAQPAFNEAVIEPVYDEVDLVPPDGATMVAAASLVASGALVAGAGPLAPPAAWFTRPTLDGPTALHITDDGRVYGHLAVWDSCHTGFVGSCVRPPRTGSDYAHFHVGAAITAEGTTVPVGRLTLGGGHADTRLGIRAARAHYDDVSTAVAVARAYEDDYGIVVAGAIIPGVTAEQLAALRRSPLSGDWREFGAHLELIAAHAVNVAGFPVPRTMVASGVDGHESRRSLVAAGALPTEAVMARLNARLAKRRRDMDPETLAKLVVREMRTQEVRRAKAAALAERLQLHPAGRAQRAAARLGAITPEVIA